MYAPPWIFSAEGEQTPEGIQATFEETIRSIDFAKGNDNLAYAVFKPSTIITDELLAKVSKLIGLSFEQFNRSVLLAQGDFAVFLKAKQADKAEILEKLTGTEIYSRVSSSIYAKTKSADMEFRLLQERMKGIELLSDDALAALDGEKLLLSGSLAAFEERGR